MISTGRIRYDRTVGMVLWDRTWAYSRANQYNGPVVRVERYLSSREYNELTNPADTLSNTTSFGPEWYQDKRNISDPHVYAGTLAQWFVGGNK